MHDGLSTYLLVSRVFGLGSELLPKILGAYRQSTLTDLALCLHHVDCIADK